MSWTHAEHISEAIRQAADRVSTQFTSPNETDRNGENANIVDALFAIARALTWGAQTLGVNGASTPMGAIEVLSKEILDGSERIANAIGDLAEAIREHGETPLK